MERHGRSMLARRGSRLNTRTLKDKSRVIPLRKDKRGILLAPGG